MTAYGLTDAEITAQLRARGVADRQIDRWLASTRRRVTERDPGPPPPFHRALITNIRAGDYPVHCYTVPWALLVSDNLHVGPNANRAKWRTYRDRRDAMRAAFRAQAKGAPLARSCQITVIFYPPNRRRRDVSNFLKAMADALEGVAYENDAQLVQYVYGRQPVDRQNPRAEIEVSEYERTA